MVWLEENKEKLYPAIVPRRRPSILDKPASKILSWQGKIAKSALNIKR